MTFFKILTVFSLLAAVSSQTCSFQRGGISASWTRNGNFVQIHYHNKGIWYNHWTAIGFGPNMIDQAVIIFIVQSNGVTMKTARTSSHAPPTFDSENSVILQDVKHSGTTLSAIINVPMSFKGVNMHSCGTWNFVQSGPLFNGHMGMHFSRPHQISNVCPSECI